MSDKNEVIIGSTLGSERASLFYELWKAAHAQPDPSRFEQEYPIAHAAVDLAAENSDQPTWWYVENGEVHMLPTPARSNKTQTWEELCSHEQCKGLSEDEKKLVATADPYAALAEHVRANVEQRRNERMWDMLVLAAESSRYER